MAYSEGAGSIDMASLSNSGYRERKEVIDNLIEELDFMNDTVMKIIIERDCRELESIVKTMQRYLDMYYELDKSLQTDVALAINSAENLVEHYNRVAEVW